MYKPPEVKPANPPDRPPRFEDVVFAKVNLDNGDLFELKMDIYQDPNQTEPGPCIVYFFGGGWLWGDYKQKDNKAVYFCDLLKLIEEGYTIVSPAYRLVSQSVFPACIHDCKGAIRFLKGNADRYHIDPERIGVIGNSAGAHLAAMVAMSADCQEMEGEVGGNLDVTSSVEAAALYYPPTDIIEIIRGNAEKFTDTPLDLKGTEIENMKAPVVEIEPQILGFTGEGQNLRALYKLLESNDQSDPNWKYIELAKKCSPVNYASSDCPPILILHGGHDVVVPINQSELLYEALTAAEADATYISYSFGAHGPSLGPEIDQFTYNFIKTRLDEKEDC